jgi:hypothetical protein
MMGSSPIRDAVEEARHLHQIEHAGQSEWTPLLAIIGVTLFFATIGLFIFGVVEAAFHLLAGAF